MKIKRSDARLILRVLLIVLRHLETRFGHQVSIGELRAAVTGHLALLERKRFTITELAVASEQSLTSVSRWMQKAPRVRLSPHPDDARAKVLSVDDVEGALEYLDTLTPEMNEILSTFIRSPRS